MKFNDYQKEALKLAVYPNRGNNIVYPALGMNGEAGEVAEKVKKILRDQDGVWNDQNQQQIKKEIGDVLWYCAALAEEFHLELDDIAKTNIEKLQDRVKRNKIHGNGDNR